MRADWLEAVQRVELEMLDMFADLCEQNQLRYYLIGGTLLGAVRHKGFIPWDFDIDVVMPRSDYARFCELSKQQLPGEYFLIGAQDPSLYPKEYAKIFKRDTMLLPKKPQYFKQRYPQIWIDIFPLDSVPKQRSPIQDVVGTLYQKVVRKLIIRYSQDPADFVGANAWKYRLIRLLPLKFYTGLRTALMEHFNRRECAYYVNYGSQYGYRKQTIPISAYDPPAQLEFEGRLFRVPGKWDDILTRIFGDYMQLPPENKRVIYVPSRVIAGPEDQTLSP